jgi:DNA-binding NarL/FixJ family response regulator
VARASLRPPKGLEAALLDVGGEQLLVLRLPRTALRRPAQLTPAERRVAELAVAGLSNAQIATDRRRSARTIANQLASIFRKLGVGSRAELARALVPP